MSDSAPPPPPNSAADSPYQRCPNCGATVPVNASFCANCGARFASGQGYGFQNPQQTGPRAAFVVWLVLLVLIGLPALAVGACGLLFGLSAPNNGGGEILLFLGVPGFLIFFGILFGLIKSRKG